MRWCLLLLTFWIHFLHAKLEDHFKKPCGKSDIHHMRNIDFIYMINLDQRPEKYALCERQLTPYGIHPYRFSAVNGWELSLDAINDLGVRYSHGMRGGEWGTYFPLDGNGQNADEKVEIIGRTYFCHCMSAGMIGIVLSHLSVLQDAYDSGYETIWVMEDDIEIIKDPHLLSDLIEKLDELVGKNEWDILFTDRDTKNRQGEYVICLSHAWRPNFTPPNPNKFAKRQKISSDFKRIGARYGAYSMIVRRSGMKKILDFFKQYQIFLPYDMEYTLPSDITFFALNNDIVSTQITALSDNGLPNYKYREL